MIPIRIPADFKPTVAPRVLDASRPVEGEKPHWLLGHYCPACDGLFSPEDGLIVLVPVGIAPEDRQASGWTTAGTVAVHLACSGYTEADIEQLAQERFRD